MKKDMIIPEAEDEIAIKFKISIIDPEPDEQNLEEEIEKNQKRYRCLEIIGGLLSGLDDRRVIGDKNKVYTV